MNLSTEHFARCIQTLQASFGRYQATAPESVDQEIFRNAVVKGFELT